MIGGEKHGTQNLKIAIVGSGIAGMSAAWLLSQKHDVTVYELENRLGGHAHTVDVTHAGVDQPVDTGFIVYNEVNYPNLVALFDHLGVQTQPSEMSFSVSIEQGQFEFGSRTLNSAIGQRSNIFKPKFWGMLSDIRSFFKAASEALADKSFDPTITLGEFLAAHGYGQKFIEHFILPMAAAIWSSKPSEMRKQPAITFIKFFASHGLLHFKNQIPWRTVTGGSREYVKKLTAAYSDNVKLGYGVKSVSRSQGSVKVLDYSDKSLSFDHVVIATHADEALNLLSDADVWEEDLLGSFRYIDNRVLLHSDTSLMPKRKTVWSSWNFLGSSKQSVSVTYWMNLLQDINNTQPYFVSVNPPIEPKPDLLHRSFQYQHPFFDSKAWMAQQNLWYLQGQRNTWFCGSYFGYGFHEDALQSGLAVAEELGNVHRPWQVNGESDRIYRIEKSARVIV